MFCLKILINNYKCKSIKLLKKDYFLKPFVSNQVRRSVTTTPVIVNTINQEKIIGKWLLTCAGMCFGAVVIGGITRLTESGLSITQWNVIKGMKPPMNEDEWVKEFEAYKQFPEYKYLGHELTLEGFKTIFYWEYVHRMWGRSIGVIFLLPAIYFWKKGWVTRAMKPRLAVYGLLLAFQGALGWYMVKSGLEENSDSTSVPRVSPYRLAAHLGSAMILYTLFFFQGLNHIFQPYQLVKTKQIRYLKIFGHSIKLFVFLTSIMGAFVAGMDAGLVYNTWPKMADRWIPDDLFVSEPKWKNFFENATAAQFLHRHLGETTGALVAGMWVYSRRVPIPPRTRAVINALAFVAMAQGLLGIATLLTYVPVSLASAHQGGALGVLSLALWLTHELRRLPK